MLLIVVAHMDIGAQSKVAAVCGEHIVQDFKKRGLSGSVVPDNGQVLTSADVKTDICKESLVRKGFAQMLYRKDIVSADTGGLQCQMDVCFQFSRLLYALHLVQHFFTALCALDGLFAIKRAEFLDNSLLVPNFLLLVHVFLQPGIPDLLFLFCIGSIIPQVGGELSLLDLHHLCYHPVQKITVVGYDEHGPGVIQKIGLQPGDGI